LGPCKIPSNSDGGGSRATALSIRSYSRLLFIFSILRPGFITANVDRRRRHLQLHFRGRELGYSLLWIMIPVAITPDFRQEIAARIGAITGKGLSELGGRIMVSASPSC